MRFRMQFSTNRCSLYVARIAMIFINTGLDHCRLLHRAVTALATPEFFHGGYEIFLSELRPQLWRDIHFRIGSLPKQEVRQTHFARRANKEVWIGIVAGVKMFAEHLYVDHCLVDMT